MTSSQTVDVASERAECLPTFRAGLSTEAAHAHAALFKALSDPTRLQLISMVAAQDKREACVCDLTEPLNLQQPTVSHHLKILVDAGILRREKRGVWAYYSLAPGALDQAAAVLESIPADRHNTEVV